MNFITIIAGVLFVAGVYSGGIAGGCVAAGMWLLLLAVVGD